MEQLLSLIHICDQITKKDDKIKVEEDNGKWKVSLANTTVNEDLWKSSFKMCIRDRVCSVTTGMN